MFKFLLKYACQRKKLTDVEKALLLRHRETGFSLSEKAIMVNRNKIDIRFFLKDSVMYGTVKRPGPKPKLQDRDLRQLFNVASNGKKSSTGLKTALNLPVSAYRVRQVLTSSHRLEYMKRKQTPKMGKSIMKQELNLQRKICFLGNSGIQSYSMMRRSSI